MLRLTRAQVRQIDRLAIERYHIPGVVLMENAARAAADVACDMLSGDCEGQILILCGGGNNGGDGLAAARHLHNRGADALIALAADPSKYRDEALVNWRIVQAMGLTVAPIDPVQIEQTQAVLIIDALFGTGLTTPPRDPFGQVVEAVHRTRLPVLAIDLPSGLDCDTGHPLDRTIRATHTVTFVAEKTGFANPAARDYLGQVTVADIGCPHELIAQVLRDTPA